MILQLLHVFWSYLIIQMIFGVILHGAVWKIFVSSVPSLLMRDYEIQAGSCMPAGKGVGEMGLPNKQPESFLSHVLGVVWIPLLTEIRAAAHL